MLSGRKNRPALVFLAAGEGQAYADFELGATDYLIWPAADDRVQKTLLKLSDFKSRFREVPMPEKWAEAPHPEARAGGVRRRRRNGTLPLPAGPRARRAAAGGPELHAQAQARTRAGRRRPRLRRPGRLVSARSGRSPKGIHGAAQRPAQPRRRRPQGVLDGPSPPLRPKSRRTVTVEALCNSAHGDGHIERRRAAPKSKYLGRTPAANRRDKAEIPRQARDDSPFPRHPFRAELYPIADAPVTALTAQDRLAIPRRAGKFPA